MVRKGDEVIAVTDGLASAGRITFWSLHQQVDLESLRTAWVRQGRAPELLPDLPSPSDALRYALNEQKAARRLVRPLGKKDGWAVVVEKPEGDSDLDWDIELRVNLDIVRRLTITPPRHKLADEIRAAYSRYLNETIHNALRKWLVNMVALAGGVRLKDEGHVYFVPQDRVDWWLHVKAAVEGGTACRIETIPAMRSEDAFRAVVAAVTAETEAEAKKMQKDITTLGSRGLRSRVDEVESIERKVGQYEGLLGKGLDDLHEKMRSLKASIAAALLLAEKREADEQAR